MATAFPAQQSKKSFGRNSTWFSSSRVSTSFSSSTCISPEPRTLCSKLLSKWVSFSTWAAAVGNKLASNPLPQAIVALPVSHAGTLAMLAATLSKVDATCFAAIVGKTLSNEALMLGGSFSRSLLPMISNMALKFMACPPCSCKASVTFETAPRISAWELFISVASSGISLALYSKKALL
eukprot:Skav218453  [mRNA]  locus=scaffold538:307386:308337:+ [translate_table: standard]